MNWKETPKESCEKFAGHIFLKQLRKSGQSLSDYATEQKDRNHIIWQRNPLAILLTNRVMAGGKIEDMHYNPAQHRWQLY